MKKFPLFHSAVNVFFSLVLPFATRKAATLRTAGLIPVEIFCRLTFSCSLWQNHLCDANF
jgi:hypothetical protein